MAAPAPALERERRLVLSVLLGLALVGWAVVVWQAVTMDHGTGSGMSMDMPMDMPGMDMAMGKQAAGGLDLTMGMAAPLFLAMWVAMMAGMMFPASAPMILAFARSQSRKRAAGAAVVPTWLFVAPYVVVWLAFGAAGYLIALWVDALAGGSRWSGADISRLAAVFLIAAGAYQLTSLKRVCLSRCRTPLSFMLSYWRPGPLGAMGMGLRHGLFCVGCCWALFLVLFPLGVMNVAAMVAVAALVFAEKALPRGETIAAVAAAVLVAYGVLALVVPAVLPTSV